MRLGEHADRRRLRAAVLGEPDEPDAADTPAYRVVRGRVVDSGPSLLTLATASGRQSVALAPGTRVWRGEPAGPDALLPGDDVLVRTPRDALTPDRIWAAFDRVTGVITAVESDAAGHRLEVDTGPFGRRPLLIPRRYADRIAVRHPRLRPGYLLDVIGLRPRASAPVLHGVLPATSQPPRPGERGGPGDPPAATRPTGAILSGPVHRGGVTWYATSPGDGVQGLAYPAIDPGTEAGAAWDATVAGGRPYLPYLSVGSAPEVCNDCTGLSARLPVLACAATAPLFHDRCVTCGTSPRGRLAELTPAAFVALGGELEAGCFNATVTVA